MRRSWRSGDVLRGISILMMGSWSFAQSVTFCQCKQFQLPINPVRPGNVAGRRHLDLMRQWPNQEAAQQVGSGGLRAGGVSLNHQFQAMKLEGPVVAGKSDNSSEFKLSARVVLEHEMASKAASRPRNKFLGLLGG